MLPETETTRAGKGRLPWRTLPSDGALPLIDDVMYPPSWAAFFLGRSESSLAKDRVYQRGCCFYKVGRSVAYRGSDLRAAREACRIEPQEAA